MKKVTKLLLCAAFVPFLMATPAKADETVEATQSTSPDGTTTTVITTPPSVTPPPVIAPTTTEIVVEKPVAVDALSGQPVENTTAPVKEEKESLRDKVRSKME